MSSALPATPVSTTAASPPRTRMYAETKPRLTRVQSIPPAVGEPDASVVAAALGMGVPEPEGDVPAAESLGPSAPDARGVVDAAAQPATPRTASATEPRPRSARKVRRVRNGRMTITRDRTPGRRHRFPCDRADRLAAGTCPADPDAGRRAV